MKKQTKIGLVICAALTLGLTVGAQDKALKTINDEGLLSKNLTVATQPVQEKTLKIDLPTAVATAVNQNYSIAIAEEKLAGAKAAVGEAAAAKNPTLAYSFQGAKQK